MIVFHELAELTMTFALKPFFFEEKDAACIKDQPGGLCAGTLDLSTPRRCYKFMEVCTKDSPDA